MESEVLLIVNFNRFHIVTKLCLKWISPWLFYTRHWNLCPLYFCKYNFILTLQTIFFFALKTKTNNTVLNIIVLRIKESTWGEANSKLLTVLISVRWRDRWGFRRTLALIFSSFSVWIFGWSCINFLIRGKSNTIVLGDYT